MSSTSSASNPPSCATAVLASRAETPTRSSPVMSLRSAQRPASSRASSHAAELRRRSLLLEVASASTTSVRMVGTCGRGGLLCPMDAPTPSPLGRGRAPAASRPGGGAGRGPDQGRRLGEVADVMVGHPEQDRIDPLLREAADHVGLRLLEHERAGHGGERPAAVRVGRMAEIVDHEPELRVAARLVHEPVEERGEAVHGPSSSVSRAGGGWGAPRPRPRRRSPACAAAAPDAWSSTSGPAHPPGRG